MAVEEVECPNCPTTMATQNGIFICPLCETRLTVKQVEERRRSVSSRRLDQLRKNGRITL